MAASAISCALPNLFKDILSFKSSSLLLSEISMKKSTKLLWPKPQDKQVSPHLGGVGMKEFFYYLPLVMSVSMNPGAIQFTRTLTGPSSFAKALVNPKGYTYEN